MNRNHSNRDYSLPKTCKLGAGVEGVKQQIPIAIDLSTNVDLETAIKRAEDLLRERQKIKLGLRVRGREMANTELGFERMKKALVSLATLGRPEAEPKLIGRSLFVIVSPLY